MSYSRVSYKSVLDEVVAFSGQLASGLDAGQVLQLNGFINTRLKDWAWVGYGWPEVTLTELRRYRATYAAATAYVATDEVWFAPTRLYYQALRASTGQYPATLTNGAYVPNEAYWTAVGGPYQAPDFASGVAYAVGEQVRNPADNRYYQCHTAHTSSTTLNASYWGVLTVFDPVIAKDQAWEANAMGEVLGIYLDDPRVERHPRRLQYRLDGAGAHVQAQRYAMGTGSGSWAVPVDVWVVFRQPCPEFRGSTYSALATYAAGVDVVYFTGGTTDLEGDYWRCVVNTTAGQSPATTPASWERLEFPAWLRTAVARKAFADWLRYGGNREAAQAEDAAAEDALYQVLLVQSQQQGQQLKWRKG